MPYRLLLLPVALLILVLAGLACGEDEEITSGGSPSPQSSPAAGSPTPTAASPTPPPCAASAEAPDPPKEKTYDMRPEMTIDKDKKYTATVKTVRGDFTIELRPDLAPETVNSFVFLAREGYFNGVTFHRVIPGFVAQGGDPTGTGSGGPGYSVPAEFSETPYERGTVGMARSQEPDSGGSQFFIAYSPQPGLDRLYTVFGKVSEGMEVVDCLTPRDPSTNPNLPAGDAIISVEIKEG